MSDLAIPLDPAVGTVPAQAPPAGRRKGERHAAAVVALREMIVSGRLAPRARLRETELCGALGISRTPLREAIRTLAREGLVKLLPNRSAAVAELDVAEIESLFEVVGNIESLAARLACERAADTDIAEIAILHHRMVLHHLRGELAAYLELNQAIHRAIVRAARNPVLEEMWELLAARVRRARSLPNLHRERWQAALHEHEEMLAALGARDGVRLSALMVPHYMNGLAVLKSDAAEGKRPSLTAV